MKSSIVKWGIIGAIAAVTGLAPRAAQAQNGFDVKVGVFAPTSGQVRDDSGSTDFDIEGDYHLGRGYRISTGYTQNFSSGGRLRVIPLTVGRISGFGTPVTGHFYYGYGAGAYFLSAANAGVSDSNTRLGGYGLLGYHFPASAYFVEGKYILTGKVLGTTVNGFAFLVGRDF